MDSLSQQLQQIIEDCQLLPEEKQGPQAKKVLALLLAEITINPTGDDPLSLDDGTHLLEDKTLIQTLIEMSSTAVCHELSIFTESLELLNGTSTQLSADDEWAMKDEIRQLANTGCLHPNLIDKFKIPANRQFLEKALHNTNCLWQVALVANWVLNTAGLDQFSQSSWQKKCPEKSLKRLVEVLLEKITFRQIADLRTYRKDAMHHYPRITVEEFQQLKSSHWQEIIDFPSQRKPEQDIPFVTPFIKQGDIEHSLYRHFLMPDLLKYMRSATPPRSKDFDLQKRDQNILLSLPIVIQQVEEEIFSQVKNTIAGQINNWAKECRNRTTSDVSDALMITEKIWGYKRTPPAQECAEPVENLIKGFTATIRNAFSHFSDINIAASKGSTIEVRDVAEKFVLFASVSNGQLDNLANAHSHYLSNLPDPANWDNERFFQHFLEVNQNADVQHIQGHFVIDKTRGCPAVPQISRFHEIVLDLVLDFTLREFGEENLRNAGNWYLKEKVIS